MVEHLQDPNVEKEKGGRYLLCGLKEFLLKTVQRTRQMKKQRRKSVGHLCLPETQTFSYGEKRTQKSPSSVFSELKCKNNFKFQSRLIFRAVKKNLIIIFHSYPYLPPPILCLILPHTYTHTHRHTQSHTTHAARIWPISSLLIMTPLQWPTSALQGYE